MPDTSDEAFEAIKPHLNDLHRQVLGAVIYNGGLTISQTVQDTGLIYATALRRTSELKRYGLLKNTEARDFNPRGRKEIVAVATDLGRNWYYKDA